MALFDRYLGACVYDVVTSQWPGLHRALDTRIKLPNGHINFEKFWQLAKQVTEFIAWKQVACPFEKNPRVIAFLQASPVLTENTLALASFECEPPDNNPEKERYKALK
ncbi:Ras-GEF domain-containing family member 1B [Cyphomyrmex costatus]|uniref:Ras-GEF domain-containing family member 1B n=1 Tax=Cyphomyrmex costatus TaxID=456900 RepID=A0A151IDG9_9HYME|nr:Ras-GEF domain-containing family member 1B [Cyphomyrmex costatus]